MNNFKKKKSHYSFHSWVQLIFTCEWRLPYSQAVCNLIFKAGFWSEEILRFKMGIECMQCVYWMNPNECCFFLLFWGFPLSHVVLNFISLHPGVPGYCVYMDKVCPAWPGSRLLQPGSRLNGTSRSPYKRNPEIPVYRDITVYRDHINRP